MVKTDRKQQGLGVSLADRLDQLGMSRRELSRRANLSRQTIHNIEHEGATNLKPNTFKALDAALKWPPGTALSLSLGVGDPRPTEERVNEYVARITVHLSQMSTEELELTLVMLEEHDLGCSGKFSGEQYYERIVALVKGWRKEISRLRETAHSNDSQTA